MGTLGTQNKSVPDVFQECRDRRCSQEEQDQREVRHSGDSSDEAGGEERAWGEGAEMDHQVPGS